MLLMEKILISKSNSEEYGKLKGICRKNSSSESKYQRNF